MDFFESIKQGVIGLLLFTGNWILPENENAALSVESIKRIAPAEYQVITKMEMSINKQLEQLIDAGVPLNFRFTAVSDIGDTVSMVRSLRCNVADLTYSFIDSSMSAAKTSKRYPMILLALRDFSKWKFTLPSKAASCNAEAEILCSRVSQLNRSVDMSRIWGHQKLKVSFTLEEGKK